MNYSKVIQGVDLYSHMRLRRLGFFHAVTTSHPPIGHLSLSCLSKRGNLPFPVWTRPGEADTTIVFLHGIGTGLNIYIEYLKGLCQKYPSHKIIAPEFLNISMRLISDIPTKQEVCDGFYQLLEESNFQPMLLIGHR